MAECRFDECKITLHFLYMATDLDPDTFTCRNGIAIFHSKLGSHAGCLKLAVDDPSAKLIHQRSLDPAMQGLQPTLIVIARIPKADKIIPILIKLHLKPVRILRATREAVVPLLLQSKIWVSYLFHFRLLRCLEALGVLGDLELVEDVLDGTVHEDRKIVHRVVDAMVGHTGLRIVVCTDLC